MKHTLYLYRATAPQVLEFLTQSQSILFNCDWQMHPPLEEPQTHNVYCDLTSGDLDAARIALGQVAALATPAVEWKLMPDRI